MTPFTALPHNPAAGADPKRMRTTATFTVTTSPWLAREAVVEFLESEGVTTSLEPDWDGTPLWTSCAVRFSLAGTAQDYAFEVHIRSRVDEDRAERSSIEVRQDACGYRGDPTGKRWSEVQLEHLDDALRDALRRKGVLEHVEQFS